MNTTLADQSERIDPVHLLLIADTKLGKSSYTAQAAIDGFHMLYIDADNGLSALRHRIGANVEAANRVHYLPTGKPALLLEKLFDASRLFQWNLTKDTEYVAFTAEPDDEIFTIDIAKWLSAIGCINVIDSWTAVAADCLGIGADKARVSLAEMGNESQRVYGNAFQRANIIMRCLQHSPMHCIVQAHGTTFEKYEKPEGKATKDMKQNEFKLIETLDVPISTSRPHGREMGKHFNHIAWLDYDPNSSIPITMIDFRRSVYRVSGGPPNCFEPADTYGFGKYARSSGGYPEGTFESRKASELKPAANASLAAAGPQEVKPLGLAGLNLNLKPKNGA